jgi:3-oxoadipate enol-lactonase
VGTLIRVAGTPRIAVECSGAGPLLMCLHGLGGNRLSWQPQIPALAREFTVAAWDARGYLDSDDYEGPLHFADFAADLHRALDHFGAERAHLLGHSMGGRIALDFYARHPQRVATLVLADTSAGSAEQASPEKVEQALALRRKPLLEGKSLREIAPSVAHTLVGPQCPPEVFSAAVEALAALHRDSYLKTLETVTRHTQFPPFASVRVPVLVIVGQHDRIATPQYARSMAESFPDARLRVLPRVGHLSNMEDPLAFNAAVLEFLREYRDRASVPLHAPRGEAS